MHRYANVLLAAALIGGVPALATAGFAEWEIYTPGGHLIAHSDLWKEEHGDVLRSDARPSAGDATLFVTHLRRWRYYPGHVAGEADRHFLFDERTEQVRWFDDAASLDAATGRLGTPLSPWLTGADGWREGWFPFFVWRPCAMRREGLRVPADITAESCRKAMSADWMRLYRRTTWGRICHQWSDAGFPGGEMAFLEDFCEAVEQAR